MTSARSLLVDPDTPGFYHCISRCVRRAWLCGIDPYNGKSYEHRREWVEQRLLELAEIFAVGVYAYAVMSNHVHVVLRIEPTAAATWRTKRSRRVGFDCFRRPWTVNPMTRAAV